MAAAANVIRRSDLRFALHAEARGLAGMYGLRIMEGNPAINLKHGILYLPPIPVVEDPVEAQSLMRMFRRWLAHECGGHARFTAPDILERYLAEMKQAPLLHGLFMSIEDPRIERAYMGQFRGGKQILNEGLLAMMDKQQIRTGEGSPGEALTAFVHYWGRVHWQGQTFLKDLLRGARGFLEEHLERDGVDRLEALLTAELAACSSSQDAMDLAQEILELVEEIAEEQEQQDSQSGSSSEQGSDPDAGGDSSGGQGDDADGSGGSGDQQGASSDQGSSGARSILDDDKVDGEAPVDDGSAFSQELEELIEQAGGGQSGGQSGAPALGDDGDSTVVPRDDEAYTRVKQDLDDAVAELRRRIGAILQARTQVRRRTSVSGNRLRSSALHRVAVGDTTIYRRKLPQQLPSAAVSILADLSGSMGPDRLSMVQQVSLCIGEVLSTIGRPLEILGFGADNRHPAGLAEIKAFDEPYGVAEGRIGGLTSVSQGGTPMAEAMLEAGVRFQRRDEERKLLFLLTDGQPNYNCRDAVINLDRQLRAAGVEVVGVGIDIDVSGLFQRSAIVRDVRDLGSELMESLFRALT